MLECSANNAIQAIIRESIEDVRVQFGVKNLRDITPDVLDLKLDAYLKEREVSLRRLKMSELEIIEKMLFFQTTIRKTFQMLQEAESPETVFELPEVAEKLVDEFDFNNIITIEEDYTFASRDEALRTLFLGKEAALLAFETYTSKFLLKRFFLHLDKNRYITHNKQLKVRLIELINIYGKVLTGENILELIGENVKVNNAQLNLLNKTINDILVDKSNLDYMANELANGSYNSPLFQKIISAITFANFNTIIKDYLPGVIIVNSTVNGLDVDNINNESIYQIAESSLPKGKGFEEELSILDRSSALAKLILNAMDNYIIINYKGANNLQTSKLIKSEQQIVVRPNYYYLMLVVSDHLTANNYSNELLQAITGLMAYNTFDTDGKRMSDEGKLSADNRLIGKFNTKYIESNSDLLDLMNASLHQATILSLYMNIALQKDDVLIKKLLPNANLTKTFSIIKYYNEFSSLPDFEKNNLLDLIFSLFYSNRSRGYHDVGSAPGNVIISHPLTLSISNRSAYDLAKAHINLYGWTNTRHLLHVVPGSVSMESFTILVNGQPKKIQYTANGWDIAIGDTATKLKLYELFKALTNIDIVNNIVLQQSTAFKMQNIITVVHGLLNLYEKSLTSSTIADIIISEKPIGDNWYLYSPAKEQKSLGIANMQHALTQMGTTYGSHNGVYSKATILSKEHKPLPAYGNVGVIYNYPEWLQTLKNRPSSLTLSNLFVLNSNIFKGVSAKNGLMSGNTYVDFKQLDIKDKVIVNVLYEYMQRRIYNEAPKGFGETVLNDDGTIHFQPVVYADKTLQQIIKIDARGKIVYKDLKGNINTISTDQWNSFQRAANVTEIKKALFHSMQTQYRLYYDFINNAFIEILKDLNQPLALTLESNFNTLRQNGIDIELAWKAVLPNTPYPQFLILEENGELNTALQFYFHLFDVENTNNVKASMDPDFNSDFDVFMNVGLVQFLLDIANMRIDLTNKSLKLFKSKEPNENWYVKDLNSVNNLEFKKKINILNDKIQTILAPEKNSGQPLVSALDFNAVLSELGLVEEMKEILQNAPKIYTQYYWEQELFSRNFEMSVNGPIFLHPSKGKLNTTFADIATRNSTAQKRNVTYQATVLPYTQNLINGMASTRKTMVIKEPKQIMNSPAGETASLDSQDGGEFIVLLQRILENKALSGYGMPLHHKSFIVGKVLGPNGEFLNTALFKYASYLLTNQRIRDNEPFQNMINTSLSLPIEFIDQLDFTKDYNNNDIDFTMLNIYFPMNDGIANLRTLEKLEGRNYIATYAVTTLDGEVNTIPINITVNTMMDLYNLFGAWNTITPENNTFNDASWYALASLANKVGFKLTEDHFLGENSLLLKYAKMSGNTIETLKEAFYNPIVNQLNVIQPLKFSFISNFTPNSCIKFGADTGIEVDRFNNVIPLENVRYMTVYNAMLGIQQDTEHESESVAEVTQEVNGMALDNESPEKLNLYKDIANYIVYNMSKTYTDLSFHPLLDLMDNEDSLRAHVESLVHIYLRLKLQVLNSLYDVGQTLSLVISTNESFVEKYLELKNTNGKLSMEELKSLFLENFHVPLSHLSVYKLYGPTISAVNTKIGVRRKSAGNSTVLTPHEGYSSFIMVPTLIEGSFSNFDFENYATLTNIQFSELLERQPKYRILLEDDKRYTLVYSLTQGIKDFNLALFNHYRVNGITRYIANYDQLNKLKEEIYTGTVETIELDNLSGYDPDNTLQWHVKKTVGRHLKPIDFKIIVQNSKGEKRTYSIYDFYPTEMLFKLLNASKENLNTVINEIKNDLIAKNIIPESNIRLMNVTKLTNFLRTLLKKEYANVYLNKKRSLTREDDLFLNTVGKDFTVEDLSTIVNVEFSDAEIIMPHITPYKFGITNRHSILDITPESLKQTLTVQINEVDNIRNLKSKEGNKPYKIPMYFSSGNGNVYIFDKTKINNVLTPLDSRYIKKQEDGTELIEFETGKPLLLYDPAYKDYYFVNYDIKGKPKLMFHHSNESNVIPLMDLLSNLDAVAGGTAYHKDSMFIINSDIMDNYQEDPLYQHVEILDPKYKNEITDSGESTSLGTKINAIVNAQYASYLLSLRFSSSRIPGQAYQSFSATRITNFLHGELDSMLVSSYNTWLTGGDYDIDKLYNMGYALTNSGAFIGWNKMFNKTSYLHLKASLSLPQNETPITVFESDTENAVKSNDTYPIIINGVEEKVTVKKIFELNLLVRKSKQKEDEPTVFLLNNVKLENFQAFVKVYNDIVERGIVNDSENISAIIKFLTSSQYKNKKLENQYLGKLLQNRIVYALRNNLSDIRNTVASFSPISLKAPARLKENSPKEQMTKKIHMSNPIGMLRQIASQYAGKSVVGINAAGNKLYSSISYIVEKALTLEHEDSLNQFKHILFERNFNGSIIRSFAGINYELHKENYINLVIQSKLLMDSSLDELQLRKEIEANLIDDYSKDSVLLLISLLISAATDNGKENILGVINAGPSTAGVYLYALINGMSMDEIGNLMVSEPIDFILNLAQHSLLLLERPRTVTSVIKYFYEGVTLGHYVPAQAIKPMLYELKTTKLKFRKLTLNQVRVLANENRATLEDFPIQTSYEEDDENFMDYMMDIMDIMDEFEVPKLNIYEALMSYLDTLEKVEIIKATPGTMDKVNQFATLMDGASLFASTTQILSTNQKVKSTDQELMMLILNFEDSIRNMIDVVISETSSTVTYSVKGSNSLQNLPTESEISEISNFSLIKFFLNADYAKKMINLIDKVRTDLNPLHLIYELEHFREMIRTSILTHENYYKHAIVYRTVYDTLSTGKINDSKSIIDNKMDSTFKYDYASNTVVDTQPVILSLRKINGPGFITLSNIVNDVYVHNVLSQLQNDLAKQNNIIKIIYDGKLQSVNLAQTKRTTKDGALGRKEFIEFMEKSFIPMLKEGYLSDHQKEPNLAIKNNVFVNDLQWTTFRNRTLKENFRAYGIMLLKVSDSLNIKLKVGEYSDALSGVSPGSLSAVRYQLKENDTLITGPSVMDLLFLYNTIIHRGNDGENTLTLYFSATSVEGSMIQKYYQAANFVNENDEKLHLSLSDLNSNGFDSSVFYRVNTDPYAVKSRDYKYIDISAEGTYGLNLMASESTLELKIATLLQIGIDPLTNIKFECK